MLDAYSKSLSDPKLSLKDIAPMVDELSEAMRTSLLNAKSFLSDDDPLKGVHGTRLHQRCTAKSYVSGEGISSGDPSCTVHHRFHRPFHRELPECLHLQDPPQRVHRISSFQMSRCGRAIKPWENIPVLSYLFLMGRCRGCREKISVRYPVVELLSALLAVAMLYRFGLTPKFSSSTISGPVPSSSSPSSISTSRSSRTACPSAELSSGSCLSGGCPLDTRMH